MDRFLCRITPEFPAKDRPGSLNRLGHREADPSFVLPGKTDIDPSFSVLYLWVGVQDIVELDRPYLISNARTATQPPTFPHTHAHSYQSRSAIGRLYDSLGDTISRTIGGQMVAERQLPIRTLSVFLAKAGVSEHDLIEQKKGITATSVSSGKRRIGTLHTVPALVHPPNWVSFFGDSIDAKALGLKAASAAAVLTTKVDGRLFAIAFGYGRSLINRINIEESFGLRVTLNSVDDGGIRSIDRKTFEGVTTHTREQVGKESSFSDFGIDIERDLLRAVVGTPTDSKLGRRLAGMDSLSAACRVDLGSLQDVLSIYLTKSTEGTYRTKHPWIDNIRELREPAKLDELNDLLVAELKARKIDRKWLAPPDLMDWENVGGFTYGMTREDPVPDIHLDSYLAQARDLSSLSLDTLKRHRVRVFSADSETELTYWSIYKCLYAELERKDGTYLLNSGSWYRIDTQFAARVDAEVDALEATKVPLIDYWASESEAEFNKRLATSIPGACAMDQKNVMYGGGKSKIEFCDVLTDARQMLHVKHYSGSAVLSHLFAQGLVSGSAFVADSEFRKRLNLKLPALHRLSDPLPRPRARNWEVAYIIASSSKRSLRLPFFSRVTLRNAARNLQSLGFKVTVTKVPVT